MTFWHTQNHKMLRIIHKICTRKLINYENCASFHQQGREKWEKYYCFSWVILIICSKVCCLLVLILIRSLSTTGVSVLAVMFSGKISRIKISLLLSEKCNGNLQENMIFLYCCAEMREKRRNLIKKYSGMNHLGMWIYIASIEQKKIVTMIFWPRRIFFVFLSFFYSFGDTMKMKIKLENIRQEISNKSVEMSSLLSFYCIAQFLHLPKN